MKPLPLPELSALQQEQFWALVDKSAGPDKCWPWLGATNGKKYSCLRYPQWNYRAPGVHKNLRPFRVAYELLVGPIPDGLTLDHVKERGCTTTLCINPAHAEPVTLQENIRRRGNNTAPLKYRKPVAPVVVERPIEIIAGIQESLFAKTPSRQFSGDAA